MTPHSPRWPPNPTAPAGGGRPGTSTPPRRAARARPHRQPVAPVSRNRLFVIAAVLAITSFTTLIFGISLQHKDTRSFIAAHYQEYSHDAGGTRHLCTGSPTQVADTLAGYQRPAARTSSAGSQYLRYDDAIVSVGPDGAHPSPSTRSGWENTRSMARTSGRWLSSQCSTASLIASRRRCNGSSAGVRTTSTSRAMACLPRPLSTTDSPQRVSPGSTPVTRTSACCLTSRCARRGIRCLT